ncbi:MAG: transglutaminase domain-containing protein [Patescibacteria group bacterium]
MFWLILVFSFLSNLIPAFATDEFSVTQNVDYTVNQSGDGEVAQRIDITNNFSQFVPKEYLFSLTGVKPLDIQANDDSGPITTEIINSLTDTQIRLILTRTKVGKNQTTSFSLRYRLPKLATPKGKTWEITLPQFQSSLSGNLTINLKVPSSFGRLSFGPDGSLVKNDSLYSLIQLNKFNPLQKNVFVFGNIQLFNFSLKYYLNNQNHTSSLIPIALPPDTTNQKITFTKINPRPQSIETDNDGNWLAYFLLPSKSSIDIEVTGQAKIGSRTTKPAPTDTSLIEQLYWPINHPDIKLLAAKYSTPKSIYDYVVGALSYDDNRLDSAARRGALEAIAKPANSLCTDFTDLFITIARSAGIPAREIEGFAYSNNPKIKPLNPGTDLLHAWPEYYNSDTQNWIGIDPTWAKTTNGVDFFHDLDLNHLTFVIHGSKSDYPPPPGSYKQNPQQKTVNVVFANTEINPSLSPPTFSIKFNPFSSSQIIISNPNLQALDNLQITSSLLKLNTKLPSLPPLSQNTINLSHFPIFSSILPQNQKINLSVSYFPDHQNTVDISNPFHYLSLLGLIITGLTIISLGGIMLTRKKFT